VEALERSEREKVVDIDWQIWGICTDAVGQRCQRTKIVEGIVRPF
jgi:hypothetical protein